jgi:hypothetical protein
LNPLDLHEGAGSECLNDLLGGEVRVSLPHRTDPNPGGGPPIEGPSDLAVQRTALRGGGATDSPVAVFVGPVD